MCVSVGDPDGDAFIIAGQLFKFLFYQCFYCSKNTKLRGGKTVFFKIGRKKEQEEQRIGGADGTGMELNNATNLRERGAGLLQQQKG